MAGEPWYEQLREQWRPEHVRLLLIDEASPAIGAGTKRDFFYSPAVVGWDPLFRSVVEVVFGGDYPAKGADKTAYLARLRDLGLFVIEAVPFPLDALSRGERPHAHARFAGPTVQRVMELSPDGVLITFSSGWQTLGPRLAKAGQTLFQDGPVPFPKGRYRDAFLFGLRAALTRAGIPTADSAPATA